ncbi:MAG: hypothetical protein HY534_07060, partial [Chloroflexi bacterium]|nr:hypothetical protein [Chloroflexota bacterium]
MQRKDSSVSMAMIGLLVLTACAPSQSASGPADQAITGQPAPEKNLVIAIQRELDSFDTNVTGEVGSPVTGGANNIPPLADDGLLRIVSGGQRLLLLADELPSDTKGTWVVKPDGTMDVTWKLRPNAKWHDGTPVTSADFAFAHLLRNDREAAIGQRPIGQRLVRSVSTPDPRTFVQHFSEPTIAGIEGDSPLPKHILEAVYLQDKGAIRHHRYFSTDFVGTGPFKLVNWVPGSHMEFQRFDEYYRGPAKLNRIVFKFLGDPNTMAANILAEAVDVVLPVGIGVDIAVEIRDRWAAQGTGHQVRLDTRDGAESLEIMINPVYARPVNGMTQAAVRQALLQAINRQELKETMVGDLSDVALTFYHPDDENYPFVKDVINQYAFPYDVRRAQELLVGAGWVRGADGILVHQPSGERFDYQVLIRPGNGPLKQASIIQDYWKAVGVALDIEVLT